MGFELERASTITEAALEIPVVIANPEHWDRPLLQRIFSGREGFNLVENHDPPERILEYCQSIAPCVVIADEAFVRRYDPSEFAGLVDFGRLIQVLVCVRSSTDKLAQSLLRCGCMGLIRSDVTPVVLRKAVRAVSRGELWAERRVITRVVQQLLFATHLPKLTPREREILELIARGYKNRAIAESLAITHETVRWHIRSLHSKLGIEDRLGTALYARQFLDEVHPAAANTE